MKSLLPFLLSLITISTSFSQTKTELYMPIEFKKAYKNLTRSFDGTPGEKYFQNRADYNIKAEFFPESNLLIGREVITYSNNSSKKLSHLYISIYQNLYKKGGTRDSDVDPINIHDGVDIKKISVNGNLIDLSKANYYGTMLVIPLPDKISSSSKAVIEIDWEQINPATPLRRFGAYEKSSFFVGYWYPKIVVYDDILGWNAFAQTGNTELYSNYGNFNVEITVPNDFNVWSSGQLENAEEIFCKEYLNRINNALSSDDIVQVVGVNDRKDGNITIKQEKHTWKFRIENVTDFAFAVSNSFIWDATSIKIDDRRVLINVLYNESSTNYKEVAKISSNTLKYYSNEIPGVPYPYDQLTIFNGENKGMEFPAIVNNQEYSNMFETMHVTTHEIAHTYFPFYVGTNEHEYSWLDEGLGSLIGFSALVEVADIRDDVMLKELNKVYNRKAGRFLIDIPLMVGSHNAGDYTYGFMTYERPIAAFMLLMEYLGKEKFYDVIREFLKQWKEKHATPYDLFFFFDKATNQDLSWFWKPWFFEFGYADIALGDIVYKKDKTTVKVENVGGFPIPLKLVVEYQDGKVETIDRKMDIWQNNLSEYTITIPSGDIKKIHLDNSFPEANYKNN